MKTDSKLIIQKADTDDYTVSAGKGLGDFDNFPEILYKYRDWENPFHKKLITHGEIFLSCPSNFNDPFDCQLSLDYSSVSEEVLLKLYIADWKFNIQT